MLTSDGSRYNRGITLAEVLAASVIVGLILVSAMNGLGGALKTWNICSRRGDAYGLAEQLLAEILQQNYEEPGSSFLGLDTGESGTRRATWDDVDDYHNWSSVPKHKDGTPIAGFANWNRSVDIAFASRTSPNTSVVVDQGLKRITVNVTDPDGVTLSLTAWRSDSGLLEGDQESDSTAQTWIGSQLKIGDGLTLQSGVALFNRPE